MTLPDPRKTSMFPYIVAVAVIFVLAANWRYFRDRVIVDVHGYPLSQSSAVHCTCDDGWGVWISDFTYRCTKCKRVWRQVSKRLDGTPQ